MQDLNDLEEEEVDGQSGSFRQRTGSAGLKSLIKFRNRNKSGETKGSNTDLSSTDEKQKGLKGFLDSIRPRSKSDAASMKQAAMNRKKHASGGAPVVQQMLNDHQQSQLSTAPGLGASGDLDPVQRTRSTSLGARDKFRIMKERRISGAVSTNTAEKTTLSKLMSNGLATNGSSDSQVNHTHVSVLPNITN